MSFAQELIDGGFVADVGRLETIAELASTKAAEGPPANDPLDTSEKAYVVQAAAVAARRADDAMLVDPMCSMPLASRSPGGTATKSRASRARIRSTRASAANVIVKILTSDPARHQKTTGCDARAPPASQSGRRHYRNERTSRH